MPIPWGGQPSSLCLVHHFSCSVPWSSNCAVNSLGRDFLLFLLINFWLLLLVTVSTDFLLSLCSIWLSWTWSELTLKVLFSVSIVNNHFRSLRSSLEVFLLSEIFVISVFANVYIFKCIKRSFASDSMSLCAVCAICPGNYLCVVITIATSQVDNVMQITAAPGMEDVNTSMYSHPWSSTFCSDSPFPSPIHVVFKFHFLTMIEKEKKTSRYFSHWYSHRGRGRVVLQCFCHE